MRLVLLLVAVTLVAALLAELTPEILQTALKVVADVLMLLIHALVVVISFSIASLVFFAFCLRCSTEGELHNDSHVNQHQFWMWNRWG